MNDRSQAEDGAQATDGDSHDRARSRGVRQRFALSLAALVGPLVLVGVVAAAEDDEPLPGPAEAVATVLGIGGNSGDVRNDVDNRSENAGDVGQPGSCPGNACDAPGLAGEGDDADGDEGGDNTDVDDTPEDTSGDAGEGEDAQTDFDPHANGHGCDDVLFAAGDPPFGGHDTPVGPCNVDEEAEAEETPEADEESSDTDAGGEDNGSNGNGYGHEKGIGQGHEKGIGEGHEKHGDGGEAAPEETGDAANAADDGETPGNSGGKGKNK
jgi:hypothetical protein